MIISIRNKEFDKGTFDISKCNIDFMKLTKIANAQEEDIKLDKHEDLKVLVNNNHFTFTDEKDSE